MTLTPAEISRLHAEDGLMSTSDIEALDGIDFDPQADARFRSQLRSALRPPTSPPIVDDVMRRIGRLGTPVAEEVESEASGMDSLAGAVMAELGVATNPARMVSSAVREEAGTPESVWPGVASAIGADVGLELGSMLRGAIEEESEHRSIGWMSAPRQRWTFPVAAGVVIAAAAALLLWVGSAGQDVQSVAEKLTEGPVDIEALEVGAASAVQVLQMGEDAPTIILIEEGKTEADGAE